MAESDGVVSPGVVLVEWLEENGLTIARFATEYLDWTVDELCEVIYGRIPVTQAIAEELEAATGLHVRMWVQLEGMYRRRLFQSKKRAGSGY